MGYMDDFIEEIETAGYSRNTIIAYRNDLKELKHKPVKEITKEDILGAIPMSLSPRTRARRLNAFKSFFTWAKDNNIIKKKPTDKMRAIRIPKNEVVIPNKDYKKLIDGIRSEKHRLMLTLLRETGIRAGELALLKKKSIIDTGLLIDGKGNKQRIIPLLDKTRKELKNYLSDNSDGYVFPDRNGSRLSNTTIYRIAKRYLGVHPHILRHMFITNLIENNVDVYTARMLAGHSRLQTTLIYAHPSKQHLASAIERTFR